MGLLLKSVRKLQLAQSAAARAVLRAPRVAMLHRCFKVLVITCLTCVQFSPQWDWSSPPVPAEGILRILSAKEFQLAGSERKALSAVAPTLWKVLPSEGKLVPIPLTFEKSLKTCLCQMAWAPNGGASYRMWLTKIQPHQPSPPPPRPSLPFCVCDFICGFYNG